MSEPTEQQEHVADMSAQRIAHVYAEALLNAAEKQGQVDFVLEELDSLVNDVLSANPAFEVLLSGAAMGRKARAEILEQVFASRASEIVYNFLQVLNDHERLDLLRAVRHAIRDLHDTRSGRVRVQVQTAAALPEDQVSRLRDELRTVFHVEPILETHIEPALLGGLRVRIGDWQYDASVRTQLESIRQQIIARSSHEIQGRRDRFCSANGN
ncbi:MAG: ATP synthase F1 subunit delta [Planctomycetes bacterium]|nr:ATP synthase F1 subunit delta [Planctomycetota bacterium]